MMNLDITYVDFQRFSFLDAKKYPDEESSEGHTKKVCRGNPQPINTIMKEIDIIYSPEAMDSLITSVKDTGKKWLESSRLSPDDAATMSREVQRIVERQRNAVNKLLAYEIIRRTLELMKENPPASFDAGLVNLYIKFRQTWREAWTAMCNDMDATNTELPCVSLEYFLLDNVLKIIVSFSYQDEICSKASCVVPRLLAARNMGEYNRYLTEASQKCDRIMYTLFQGVSQMASEDLLREYLTALFRQAKTQEKIDGLEKLLFPSVDVIN